MVSGILCYHFPPYLLRTGCLTEHPTPFVLVRLAWPASRDNPLSPFSSAFPSTVVIGTRGYNDFRFMSSCLLNTCPLSHLPDHKSWLFLNVGLEILYGIKCLFLVLKGWKIISEISIKQCIN